MTAPPEPMLERPFLAAGLAALGAVGVVAIGLFVVAGQPFVGGAFAHGSFFVVLFGWPIAFLACLVVGRLGLEALPNRNVKPALLLAVSVGAGAGGTLLALFWRLAWGSADLVRLGVIGAMAGAVASGIFWLFLGGDSRLGTAPEHNRSAAQGEVS